MSNRYLTTQPLSEALPKGISLSNGGQECDAKRGPCACGAWHNELEWAERLKRANIQDPELIRADVIAF